MANCPMNPRCTHLVMGCNAQGNYFQCSMKRVIIGYTKTGFPIRGAFRLKVVKGKPVKNCVD
jgi:hypothetical protein